MYKIEGNNIFYKSGDMGQFIHFGLLYAVFPVDGKGLCEVRKFNEKEQAYLPATDLLTCEQNGKEYPLTQGRFTIATEPETVYYKLRTAFRSGTADYGSTGGNL